MAPKRKPIPKVSMKGKEVDEPQSPSTSGKNQEDSQKSPLLNRIRRSSGDGKPVELSASATSSLEQSKSPDSKKARTVESGSADSKLYPRVSAEADIAGPVNATQSSADLNASKRIAELESELARFRAQAESLVSKEALDREVFARRAAEEELVRQKTAVLESDQQNRRKSKAAAAEDKRLAQLEEALKEAQMEKERLQDEIVQLTDEKEQLETQMDDALNSTLISYKSPGRIQGSARKSMGRLSLSGYADEFAVLEPSSAELDSLTRKVTELETVVNKQAEELEKMYKRGSGDDSFDREGMEDQYRELREQLDSERSELTRFREEASRLSGVVDSLASEKSVLEHRVRKYMEDELAHFTNVAELEHVQSECMSLRTEVETYKRRMFKAEQGAEQLEKTRETNNAHIYTLEMRLASSERDLEAAKYENSALQLMADRKTTTLMTSLNDARAEIRKLRDEASDAKAVNHQLNQQRIDLGTEVQHWRSKAQECEAKWRDAETESKKARAELEHIRQESEAVRRNFEIQEKDLTSTLADNQNEMSGLSVEIRNVKLEREHLIAQIRSLNDQVNEMKHSSAELLSETSKKHDAELASLKQRSTEMETLLQSARREKAHFESQYKALMKQGSLEAQAAMAKGKELEAALDAQKKANVRLQREASTAIAAPVAEQVDASALVGGKSVTVLGSPAVAVASGERKLNVHVSQPATSATPTKMLQRHPTAPMNQPIAAQQPVVVLKPTVAAAQPVVAVTTTAAAPVAPVAPVMTAADSSNPLAFWKAKVSGQAKPVSALATTPVLRARPPMPASEGVKKAGTTPAAIPSPLLKQSSARVEERVASPQPKRLSMVDEVRQELENEDAKEPAELSPIMAAKSSFGPTDLAMADEAMMESASAAGKENAQAPPSPVVDGYMRVWNVALSARPESWKAALSRSSVDWFQFGSKRVQCRLIGSDMLVIDGKSQMLVDRFLDQHGEALVSNSVAASQQQQPPSQDSQPTSAAPSGEVKKAAGLRFKNLRKQPLGHSNEPAEAQ